MRYAVDFIKISIIDGQIKMPHLKKFSGSIIKAFINNFMHFADSAGDAIDNFKKMFSRHLYPLNFFDLLNHLGHAMFHTKMLYS